VPADFEAFYREQLRYCAGRRIRSEDLANRYRQWAEARHAAWPGQKAICRAMVNVGHRHLRSNVIYYADVDFAENVPELADNFPVGGIGLAARIDAVMNELVAIREKVASS
jgi:uncharacterized protein YukJ